MKRDIGSRKRLKFVKQNMVFPENSISRLSEISGKLMKKPNDPDSPLYLYVGEDTDDCTDFTLSFKNTGDGKMEINGFTYTADTYEIRWTEDDGVKVTME